MIRRAWMRFADVLGRVQTTLLLVLMYVMVIGPLWLLVTVIGRRDLLAVRHTKLGSFALPKPPVPTDPERCERQF